MNHDPLAEVTRKERKWLLGISLIAVLVGRGIHPQEITAFGLKAKDIPEDLFPTILLLLTGYFLLAFFLYGVHDFIARTDKQIEEEYERRNGESEGRSQFPWHGNSSKRYVIRRIISLLRDAFDLILPIVVGVYAISAVIVGESDMYKYGITIAKYVGVILGVLVLGSGVIYGAQKLVSWFRLRQLKRNEIYSSLSKILVNSEHSGLRSILMSSYLAFKRDDYDAAIAYLNTIHTSSMVEKMSSSNIDTFGSAVKKLYAIKEKTAV